MNERIGLSKVGTPPDSGQLEGGRIRTRLDHPLIALPYFHPGSASLENIEGVQRTRRLDEGR